MQPTTDGSTARSGYTVGVADYSGGRLYELGRATGAVRHQLDLGTALPHFASMSMWATTRTSAQTTA